MSDDLDAFALGQPTSSDRPLQGLTVLVVEDSRFASEAIRLLCLKSGARIRRADTLAAAHRHLRVYRPSIVIVDMGLPDGSGAELISELAADPVRVPVLLGMSGDDTANGSATAAGADGFLMKPVESLASFQAAILSVLPPAEGPCKPRVFLEETVEPDTLALRDDLTHVVEIMRHGVDGPTQDYVAQFLGGIALSAHDEPLAKVATDLARARAEGRNTGADLARIATVVEQRLAVGETF